MRGSTATAADRLLDEVHATLVGRMQARLAGYGWDSQSEATFSEYGERGSIDLLGWHPAARALLVDEMKSELGSVEGTLRPFDIKCRLAIKIARERFGWDPAIMFLTIIQPANTMRNRSSIRRVRAARSRGLRPTESRTAEFPTRLTGIPSAG